MERAQLLYAKAIIIDATCPLASRGKYLDRWIAGGVTAIAPTVEAFGGIESAMRNLGRWLRLVREDAGRLVLVQRAGDILEAKQTGRLGIILHFQGTEPLGDDLDLVEGYHRLGVRMIQLTYNRRNRVGDGCEERTDTGLSHFGIRLIQELNRAGIVVDLSHTGYRTTMEAMEVSTAPVVFSHSNARAVCPSARNLTDDQIKAVATKGGVIGVNGFPAFVARTERPTLAQFIAHIDYIADLVGPRHVGLGLDYYEGMAGIASPEAARAMYTERVESGVWSPESYPPPPWHYPEGLEDPSGFPRLAEALLARGYHEEDVEGILGGNFLRVFRQVWGS